MNWRTLQSCVIAVSLVVGTLGCHDNKNQPTVEGRSQSATLELHDSIEATDEARVAKALKDGADPNGKTEKGITPLLRATEKQSYPIVKLLLDAGADLNGRCDAASGFYPIHMSSALGDTGTLRLLLAKGAHVNVKADKDLTPLMVAEARGQTSVAQILKEHGAK